jgi:hypothetical protein
MAQLGEFPKPPDTLSITLPGGASLTGMARLPRGLGEDCEVAFNLMLQIGPVFGILHCLISLFKFVGGLVGVVNAAPNPIAIGQKLEELIPAAEEVLECVNAYLPTGLCPPVKSILKLISQFLGCVIEALHSVLQQHLDIQIKMGEAQQQGNEELLQVLQLAQNNADLMGAQALRGCGPAFELLQSIGGIIEALGAGSLTLPSVDDLTGGGLEPAVQALSDVKQVIDTIITLLPC